MKYPDSVRGRIKNYLTAQSSLLHGDVLEIGSRREHDAEWWNCNRDLSHNANWLSVDFQGGLGVDTIADIHTLPFDDNAFDAVLCSEVMEHVKDPQRAMNEMHRVLEPNGCAIITTLFSFPVHGYPDDYWRFTPNCMKMLMENAGFINVEVTTDGEYAIMLNNIGEREEKRIIPMHIFAKGQKHV